MNKIHVHFLTCSQSAYDDCKKRLCNAIRSLGIETNQQANARLGEIAALSLSDGILEGAVVKANTYYYWVSPDNVLYYYTQWIALKVMRNELTGDLSKSDVAVLVQHIRGRF